MLHFIKNLFGLSPATSPEQVYSKTSNVFSELVHDIIAHWPTIRPFRVSEVLATHPELALDSRAMIELAIEEFLDGKRHGDSVTPTVFAQQFPYIRTALLDSLAVDLEISQLSGIFSKSLTNDKKAVVWPQIGETLANFRLKELLGKGGFSQVYLAEDLELHNREVAVKICRDDTHEASTLADLQHSAIGVVLGVRRIEDRQMIAISMQVISRVTMNDVIRHIWMSKRHSPVKGNPTPRFASSVWDAIKANGYQDHSTPDWIKTSFVDWVIQLAIQLSRGLAASHAKGYVHCDLKPSNVLITTEGQPVLIDFNVAFKQNANQSPGNVGGTLPYMAPEQIRAFSGRGYADIGAQTDVFGLGATLYQLLTGTMPFNTEMSPTDGIRALLQSRQMTPKPVRAFNTDIDERLERLIMKCLNYEVSARPQNALDVARELECIRDSRQTRRSRICRPTADRRRIGVALALAGTALVAVAVREKFNPDAPAAEKRPVVVAAAPVVILPAVAKKPSNQSIQEILIGGLEDLREGRLEIADEKFNRAIAIDPQHHGAKLGLARTKAQMHEVEEAEQLLNEIKWQTEFEPGEILAFRAYCKLQHPTKRLKNFGVAIQDSEAALLQGCENPRMLTNLAYCYFYSGKPSAKAVELLERARVKAPNVAETNILLASVYWHCRTANGVPLGKFDLQYLNEILESPPRNGDTCWRFADMFSRFAKTQSNTNPQLCSELSQAGVDCFQRACELSWDRNFWNHIHPQLAPEVRAQVEGQFADVPVDVLPKYPRVCSLLLDPLHNTRFDRVLSKQLGVGAPLTVSLEK